MGTLCPSWGQAAEQHCLHLADCSGSTGLSVRSCGQGQRPRCEDGHCHLTLAQRPGVAAWAERDSYLQRWPAARLFFPGRGSHFLLETWRNGLLPKGSTGRSDQPATQVQSMCTCDSPPPPALDRGLVAATCGRALKRGQGLGRPRIYAGESSRGATSGARRPPGLHGEVLRWSRSLGHRWAGAWPPGGWVTFPPSTDAHLESAWPAARHRPPPSDPTPAFQGRCDLESRVSVRKSGDMLMFRRSPTWARSPLSFSLQGVGAQVRRAS